MTIPAFNQYQSLEPIPSADGAPNRCVPERIEELGLLDHLTPDSTVLDIGCNRGYFGVCLSPYIGQYHGVEASEEYTHGMNESVLRRQTNVYFYKDRIENIEAESYDMILLLAVIAYLEWDMGELAQWLEDRLTPGGTVVIEGHPKGYMGEPDRCLNPLLKELTVRMRKVYGKSVMDRTNRRAVAMFKSPDAQGMAARIFFRSEGVYKRYRPDEVRLGNEIENHWLNEVEALTRLQGIPGIPDLYHVDTENRVLIMKYCGEPLTPSNLPENWENQLHGIVDSMSKRGVFHADCRVKNMLVRDGQIYLIDFGVVHYDEPRLGYRHPIEYVQEMLDG